MDLDSMCFWLPVTRKGTFAQLYVFRFTKGQPQRVLQFMAPVFTLTHHMLVWYAAWRVRPGVKFFDYALLGDDIVIADPVVAKSYLEVMEECEVTISKEKSLISNVSALEFAKRFMVHKVTLYFSLVSLRVLRTLSLLFWSFRFPVFGAASQFAVFVQVTRWILEGLLTSRSSDI
ncbi:hypothetical protein Acr_00g0002100 [Actinidia rufa]|uniref:Uncharacterized protein n=1 Tax=Actinidia rufa TaxID=165716 RepID=A0A7J0D6S0_9ERIC|nr:hypothetical protein Acr_00g0002100 [Actinidia rufa]